MKSLNLKEDIRSISDFRAHSNEFIEQINRNHRPIVLTQHGKSAAVLLDLDGYEKLTSAIELYQDIARGEEDIKEGRTFTQAEIEKEFLGKEL